MSSIALVSRSPRISTPVGRRIDLCFHHLSSRSWSFMASDRQRTLGPRRHDIRYPPCDHWARTVSSLRGRCHLHVFNPFHLPRQRYSAMKMQLGFPGTAGHSHSSIRRSASTSTLSFIYGLLYCDLPRGDKLSVSDCIYETILLGPSPAYHLPLWLNVLALSSASRSILGPALRP